LKKKDKKSIEMQLFEKTFKAINIFSVSIFDSLGFLFFLFNFFSIYHEKKISDSIVCFFLFFFCWKSIELNKLK
jgi:hypothetical protein